jgi:hypothetical protein
MFCLCALACTSLVRACHLIMSGAVAWEGVRQWGKSAGLLKDYREITTNCGDFKFKGRNFLPNGNLHMPTSFHTSQFLSQRRFSYLNLAFQDPSRSRVCNMVAESTVKTRVVYHVQGTYAYFIYTYSIHATAIQIHLRFLGNLLCLRNVTM